MASITFWMAPLLTITVVGLKTSPRNLAALDLRNSSRTSGLLTLKMTWVSARASVPLTSQRLRALTRAGGIPPLCFASKGNKCSTFKPPSFAFFKERGVMW